MIIPAELVIVAVLVGLAGYFTIGVLARRFTMPRALDREYQRYKERYADWDFVDDSEIRREAIDSVRFDGVKTTTLWFWPVMIPYYALSGRGRPIESYAPWAAEARADKAEARIRELEAELGIGDGIEKAPGGDHD